MSQTSECVWHHTVCSLCPNTCRFPFHTICHSCSVAGNFKQRCEPKLCHLHATDLPVKYNIQSNCHRWKSSCKIISTLLLIRNKTFHTEPSIKTTIFCKLSTSVTKKKKRKKKKNPIWCNNSSAQLFYLCIHKPELSFECVYLQCNFILF